MKQITLDIDEADFLKYKLKPHLNFEDLCQILKLELAKENLQICHKLAQEHGLAAMTLEDINREVKAFRNAQNHPRY